MIIVLFSRKLNDNHSVNSWLLSLLWTFHLKLFHCNICYKSGVIFKGTCNKFSQVHGAKCMHWFDLDVIVTKNADFKEPLQRDLRFYFEHRFKLVRALFFFYLLRVKSFFVALNNSHDNHCYVNVNRSAMKTLLLKERFYSK